MFKGYKPIVFDTKGLRLLKDTEYFKYKLIPSDKDSIVELRPNGFVSRADYTVYYSHQGKYSELDKSHFQYKINEVTYRDINHTFYELDKGIFEYHIKNISVIDINKNLGIENDKGIFKYLVKKTTLQDYPINGIFIDCAAINISYTYVLTSTGVTIKRTAIVKDFVEGSSNVYFQLTSVDSGIFIPIPDESVRDSIRVSAYSYDSLVFKSIYVVDTPMEVVDTIKVSTFTLDKLLFSDNVSHPLLYGWVDTLKVSEYKIDSVSLSLTDSEGIDLGWAN